MVGHCLLMSTKDFYVVGITELHAQFDSFGKLTQERNIYVVKNPVGKYIYYPIITIVDEIQSHILKELFRYIE